MAIVIRKAENKDVPALYDLMNDYIVNFYQREQPSEEALTGLILHLLDQPGSGLQFVAEVEGELVGFATLYNSFSTLSVKKAAILNDLFVAEPARGKKVGEKLFEHCIRYIRENDYAYMSWETAHDNKAAQALYDKMGGKKSEWLAYSI
ncbi:GNAT family N-acetyltransferase [Ammoniphilus sp. YIM 78166]|uniref:GNAT family N-acetyltransferase n=1 Tax=Ammoniphilus sp. YIM 78166 TaxID=1644106 RepID=UPI00106FB4B4|nr:GNAT family N-acetyltransferase [Ammoniphilus sp. YIM 78166]